MNMKKQMTIIEQITEDLGGPDAVLSHLQSAMLDSMDEGYCVSCGEFYGNVEPDARKYTCDSCGKNAVYSVTEIFL